MTTLELITHFVITVCLFFSFILISIDLIEKIKKINISISFRNSNYHLLDYFRRLWLKLYPLKFRSVSIIKYGKEIPNLKGKDQSINNRTKINEFEVQQDENVPLPSVSTNNHEDLNQIVSEHQKITMINQLSMETSVHEPLNFDTIFSIKLKRRIKIIDWVKKNQINENIGLLGEQLVLEFEKKKLIKQKLSHLLSEIEHVSITKGDGLGYDITSIDNMKNKIYIEVKSTTGELKTDIIVSRNELVTMEKINENYYLYRVFNINPKERTGQIKIYKGFKKINQVLTFSHFMVRGKIKV